MTDKKPFRETESEDEVFPVEPRYHPIHLIPRRIYDLLASAKLALVLLITILVCSLAGVTLWRGPAAWLVIFNSLWFNAILVLLVINIACCFFGRIWGRRITVVSFGMILFHISFVVMLLAIVFNSLFYFRGIVRVTEGETVPNGDPLSYDQMEKGRFFNFSRLKGTITLVKMHTGYKVSGDDKRAAYEVVIGEPGKQKNGLIYITHKLTHNGVDYFNDREGYSLLMMLGDSKGKEIYGVHVPLQSMKGEKGKTTRFGTGYRDWEKLKVVQGVIPFPAPPERTLFALQSEYLPDKSRERSGEVLYELYPLDKDGKPVLDRPFAEGKAAVGSAFNAGKYQLTAQEVRYWVGMMVRYEPGKPILLTSLWVALAGMIITTAGRMMKQRGR